MIRVRSCDRVHCGGHLHLHLEVVEEGAVTYIGEIQGQDGEAVARSGRLFRVMLQFIHGEDEVDVEELMPDQDDEHGVLRGTKTLQA